MMNVHHPVLVSEVMELLAPVAQGFIVDATVGMGGHAREILRIGYPKGRVLGIDRDEKALAVVQEQIRDDRFSVRQGKFSDLEDILVSKGMRQVDGFLFDLGVSMMQLKDMSRGFSFMSDERLDMRMGDSSLTASDVVNRYPREKIEHILREYGEEPFARKIARFITERRRQKTIETCAELAAVVAAAVKKRGKTHPATRTFQALRIEVNNEIHEIKDGLETSLRFLSRGGRLCVISYHSLEDRIVKNFVRENARLGLVSPLSKKPLRPQREEIRSNPSARSAKLRGAERL